MLRIMRYIFIPAATVAAIVGIAAFFNVKNPVADAVTGATVRVEGSQPTELKGEYMLVINKLSKAFEDEGDRENVKKAAAANAVGADVSSLPDFSIAVSESDSALVSYSQELCNALSASGADIKVKKYSKTLLRSRVIAGKYDVFIASRGFTDAEAIKNADYIMLKAEGMKLK